MNTITMQDVTDSTKSLHKTIARRIVEEIPLLAVAVSPGATTENRLQAAKCLDRLLQLAITLEKE